MLPAYVANAFPVIGSHLKLFPSLDIPVDRGKKFRKRALFGRSKTVRGFVTGTGGALIIGLIQFFLSEASFLSEYFLVNYSLFNALTLAFLLGVGALVGDLLKSFLKRRIGIESGKPWVLADQIDYAVGSLLFVWLFYLPPFENILIILIISPLLALAANIFSYITGMKEVWW